MFVSRPGGTKEDDDVVLTVVLDSTLSWSKLMILNAKTIKEIARAEMKTVLPVGFCPRKMPTRTFLASCRHLPEYVFVYAF